MGDGGSEGERRESWGSRGVFWPEEVYNVCESQTEVCPLYLFTGPVLARMKRLIKNTPKYNAAMS